MAKSRAANEGSIYQRKSDGRWCASVTIWEEGKRHRRVYYADTQKAALTRLKAARKSADEHLPLPSDRLTVEAFLKSWLAGKAGDLRPESMRRYSDVVNRHLIPKLGRHGLNKLTAAQVQAAYTSLRASGLSGTTLNLIHGVLHTSLRAALKQGLVVRNVSELIDVPRRSTGEMHALTRDEAMRLLDAAKGDPIEAFYVVALTAGLRLGELQALRWRDVDLDRRRLKVAATFQGFEDAEPVFASPKTERSRREVHLSALAVDALRAHRTRQIEQRLQAGVLWQDHDLVFANGLGRPLDGNNIRTRSFARLLKRAGLPSMRFHTLRHSAATLLMSQGVPVKVASEMLGHADITTTLRIYSHVLPSMQEQAASAMDQLFGAR